MKREQIIEAALKLLDGEMRVKDNLSSPSLVKDYLRLRLAGLEHEVFVVVFLDAQHQLLAVKEMFRGTVSETCVYPREVVKEAMRLNASGVVLGHNHPSGNLEPSGADIRITSRLKQALDLVGVRVLDHCIVSEREALSFAERGLM